MRNEFKSIILGFCSLLAVLLLWQIGAQSGMINSDFFPEPVLIFRRLFELLTADRDFVSNVMASLQRLAIGSILAIPLAIALALLVALNWWARHLLAPIVAVTYPLPKLALLPLFLIIFGIGETSKIAIIFIGVFFLVFFTSVQALEKLVASGVYDIIQVYKIPFLPRIFKILLRGALPEILVGIKAGVGYGLVNVVAGEFSISTNGIGMFIWNAWDRFQIVDLYCGLFVLSAMGLILFSIIDWLRKKANWISS